MLRGNLILTSYCIVAYFVIAALMGASLNTNLSMCIMTFASYASFVRKIELNLLLPTPNGTSEVLGAQIFFTAKFLIAICATSYFGDQHTAFFGGIVLWHIYLCTSDSLSQKLLRENKNNGLQSSC